MCQIEILESRFQNYKAPLKSRLKITNVSAGLLKDCLINGLIMQVQQLSSLAIIQNKMGVFLLHHHFFNIIIMVSLARFKVMDEYSSARGIFGFIKVSGMPK